MALNICGICDSQDSHQGRANKGTLNTDSGISTAQILVSDFPLGEKQTAGLLKKSVFCIFCKVFQSDFFSPLLLLRKLNVLSLLALSCSSPCCGGEASSSREVRDADRQRQQSRQDGPADTCGSQSPRGSWVGEPAKAALQTGAEAKRPCPGVWRWAMPRQPSGLCSVELCWCRMMGL